MPSTSEHVFRHEYGKLVASLVNKFTIHHIESIEDAIQWSMEQAVDVWAKQGLPQTPAAWLHKVAQRHLLTQLKQDRRQQQLLKEQNVNSSDAQEPDDIPLKGEMSNALLRMLFAASHPSIPMDSQITFILKALCGFDMNEIAQRLFISEANAYKRFNRAKTYLKEKVTDLTSMSKEQMEARVERVHNTLYLMFTEGYLSSHAELTLRLDLCEESLRLALFLAESELNSVSETHALIALMQLHLARMSARQNSAGELLMLEQQNRGQWDQSLITQGLLHLEHSTKSDNISRYHVEAGIAAEHCLSPTFEQTNWQRICASYALLEKIAPSPLHTLNKALAKAEWLSPEQALQDLHAFNLPTWLEQSYYWYAVLADLQARSGLQEESHKNSLLAIEIAPSNAIKQALLTRLRQAKSSLS